MPTPGERRALLFLAGVALLGGAVRLVGAGPARPLPAEDLAALDRQLAAADTAAAARGAGKAGRARRRAPGRVAGARGAASRRASPPPAPPRPPATRPPPPEPAAPVDLDRASAAEIEALPGIGPALAARIVAWRDSAGGLGALEALDCVSGVGPALLARLRSRVTFSGGRRPSCVGPRVPAGRRPRRPR